MKTAVIGSRSIKSLDLEGYLADAKEIVSGGAEGVDSCAANFAKSNGIKLTLFLPEYSRYGRAAPIVRNKKIVDYADKIVVFWDGVSRGTLSVIKYAEKLGKPCEIIRVSPLD
jgi:predicted Rossmann fold nucleotide-binding protein DprA/Smf involved in DNA uptake